MSRASGDLIEAGQEPVEIWQRSVLLHHHLHQLDKVPGGLHSHVLTHVKANIEDGQQLANTGGVLTPQDVSHAGSLMRLQAVLVDQNPRLDPGKEKEEDAGYLREVADGTTAPVECSGRRRKRLPTSSFTRVRSEVSESWELKDSPRSTTTGPFSDITMLAGFRSL